MRNELIESEVAYMQKARVNRALEIGVSTPTQLCEFLDLANSCGRYKRVLVSSGKVRLTRRERTIAKRKL